VGQITLRNMDPRVEEEIRRMAHKTGKSLNRVIVDMIYECTGFTDEAKKPRADSLRKLAGGWSDTEAAEFMESIETCERIDEDMWK
jgi:hypothetical protein